jgi:hypothetical protein
MGTVSQTVRVYRFGTFAVDVKTGELTSAGRRMPLREQPLQLLLALLERHGELITREELTAEHPQFIETLPRKGYRFIAPVTEDAQDLEPAARSVPSVGWRIRRWLAASAAVVAVVGIAIVADIGGARSWIASRGTAAPHITSIAVLPLENLSNDPEQDGEPPDYVAHIGDALQKREEGHQGHRARTECRRGCRGHRHAVGRTRADHRTADPGLDRHASLGRGLRA